QGCWGCSGEWLWETWVDRGVVKVAGKWSCRRGGKLVNSEQYLECRVDRGIGLGILHFWPLWLTGTFSESPCCFDCPDCDDSRALSFCPSFTRASHPQLHFGNPYYIFSGKSKKFRLKGWSIPLLHCEHSPVGSQPDNLSRTRLGSIENMLVGGRSSHFPRLIPTESPIITPTIPPSPDYTPASPDYSPASETEFDPSEDPSSGHIPPLPAFSPFLSSNDDTTDSDTPATPPSPTHDIPFTKITASTQRSPVIPHRRVMILAPGQPIPHGRPYRYHPNGLRGRGLDHHSSLDLPSTSAGPSRKRRRSPMTSVPTLPLVSRALSHIHADLIPSPKRVKDIGYLENVEVTYETLRDLVQRFHDHTQAIPVHRVQVIEGVQREQRHRIVEVESTVAALTERVAELERDNRRLRGTASVESQRVDRLQRGMSRMQREMRQMRRF
nr:hypothetical protein [Tanacetum cinerariifolium]